MVYIKTDEEYRYTFDTDVFGTDAYGRPIKVKGKEHYKRLMAQGGFVPFEEAQKIAEEAKNNSQHSGYKHDPDLVSFLNSLKQTADSKGNLRLGGRAIAKMKEFGVNFDSVMPEYLKKQQPHEGGFNAL